MKVSAKYYREIEYVVVSELPKTQQQKLTQHPDLDYIKILIDGQVVGPCLQYKEYSDWYNSNYQHTVKEQEPVHSITVKGLAWDKA